jgi:hypothetical protein
MAQMYGRPLKRNNRCYTVTTPPKHAYMGVLLTLAAAQRHTRKCKRYVTTVSKPYLAKLIRDIATKQKL